MTDTARTAYAEAASRIPEDRIAALRAPAARAQAVVTPRRNYDPYLNDPEPTTPFDVVHEAGLLRLRHYGSETEPAGPPVLIVCSVVKRPYLLDLLAERSVVRSLLHRGFSVYLVDWLPPTGDDTWRGFDSYINQHLARAVDHVRSREHVEQVSLVGCCFGGVLALVYSALYPDAVARLCTLATPLRMRSPFPPGVLDFMERFYGNAPAWWIRAGLNSRVRDPLERSSFLASELGEPELARAPSAVQRALGRWFDSDVPLAARLFRELMCDAYGDAQLADSRLAVGGKRVVLGHIRSPLLNVVGEHDMLVPASSTAGLETSVGSRSASKLVFPTGHLGLTVSLAAHERLWPRICTWLHGGGD